MGIAPTTRSFIVGHAYTVEFRIYAETLDTAAITKELNLEPCQTKIPSRRGRKSTAVWAFNGVDDGGDGKAEWDSLEEGLTYVLGRLWPSRTAIAKYKASAELFWWCGHFQSSFDGGPQLSPSLLSRLGEFGATLYIDNYFGTGEGDGGRRKGDEGDSLP
jgi:hypothetical protein